MKNYKVLIITLCFIYLVISLNISPHLRHYLKPYFTYFRTGRKTRIKFKTAIGLTNYIKNGKFYKKRLLRDGCDIKR